MKLYSRIRNKRIEVTAARSREISTDTRPTFPLWESVKSSVWIITSKWGTAFRPANKGGRLPRGRRRSRQDSHYARRTGNAMKSVGWLRGVEDPPFSRRRRKGIKGRQKAAFNAREGRQYVDAEAARSSSLGVYVNLPSIGIAFRRPGIIRLRRSRPPPFPPPPPP